MRRSSYARSYLVFPSASLASSLDDNLGENLQASPRALVDVPSVATLFAGRQPLYQVLRIFDEPRFASRQIFSISMYSSSER